MNKAKIKIRQLTKQQSLFRKPLSGNQIAHFSQPYYRTFRKFFQRHFTQKANHFAQNHDIITVETVLYPLGLSFCKEKLFATCYR
jgi:hypothetical protein